MKGPIELDHLLLEWINRELANPVFDLFFPLWTDFQKHPFFIYLVLPLTLLTIVYKKNWRTLKILIIGGLGTWVTSYLNHAFIKHAFERTRPTDVILRIVPHSSFSFPSGHSLTAFFLASFLGFYFQKQRPYFFTLAILTAFSRVYCGVHYPADVLAGAFLGFALAYSLYRMLMLQKLKFLTALIVFTSMGSVSAAWEDPTKGKPFFPWVWEDQLKPTLKKSVDKTGLIVAGSGLVAVEGVHQYDHKIYAYNDEHRVLFDEKSAKQFGKLGNGVAGISIAAAQIYFDQSNGLKHARALLLTTTSQMSISALVRRDRPNNTTDFLPWPSSFPSGHSAAAFVTAGSLAYSYGWKAGIPAYAVATSICLSRIRENRHWGSDVVAGAFIGTFWARASFNAEEPKPEAVTVVPVPIYDGMMLSAVKAF